MHRSVFTRLLTVSAASLLFFSLVASAESSKKNSVIVSVHDGSKVDHLVKKYGLKLNSILHRDSGAVFLVEGLSEGQVKQLLKDEPDFDWAEANRLVPLDGGETVLPLDGGETVLPLDGGETVLPLGAVEDLTITHLLDGGETVLPLDELNQIRNAYSFMAAAVTPSTHLLIQPAFRKIGLYPSVPRATGRGVIIADLDTGADTCHEALRGIVTYTFVQGADANAPENCATASTPIVPGFGHGTRVASLLRLVAPEATIWSMRVFDNTGTAQTADVYAATVYAVDHGVNVINMSFGTQTYSQALWDAVFYAYMHGVTVVAAGGNFNQEPLMYPAQFQVVFGIVAVTNADVKTSFSNYGWAFGSAPAYGLWAAQPNHQIAYVAGTSYASPLVAGEAALVIDSYQRSNRGTPASYVIRNNMWSAEQPIDALNPLYAGKLGRGRMYIPSALAQ